LRTGFNEPVHVVNYVLGELGLAVFDRYRDALPGKGVHGGVDRVGVGCGAALDVYVGGFFVGWFARGC
jgi:hypothetical protein